MNHFRLHLNATPPYNKLLIEPRSPNPWHAPQRVSRCSTSAHAQTCDCCGSVRYHEKLYLVTVLCWKTPCFSSRRLCRDHRISCLLLIQRGAGWLRYDVVAEPMPGSDCQLRRQDTYLYDLWWLETNAVSDLKTGSPWISSLPFHHVLSESYCLPCVWHKHLQSLPYYATCSQMTAGRLLATPCCQVLSIDDGF